MAEASSDGAVKRVVGLGEPVSDVLVRLDEPSYAKRVFAACGIAEPGGCLPVDADEDIARLLAVCGGEWVDFSGDDGDDGASASVSVATPECCPGGSAANVMKGIANLGGAASFVGMIGKDETGARYRALLASQNVSPILLECEDDDESGGERSLGSARCISLVERDGQRTMRTYLGASLRMSASDFPTDEALTGAALLHVEGYALYRPELCLAATRAAKARGLLVSLDLASFEARPIHWSPYDPVGVVNAVS